MIGSPRANCGRQAPCGARAMRAVASVFGKTRERREMVHRQDGTQVYLCPIHSHIRQTSPGKCPKCGMDLLPEGTKLGMLRHMIKSPLMLTIMAAFMVAIMAAAMMMMR